MRELARLLFGGNVTDRHDDEEERAGQPAWDEGFGLADRARRSGEWCGTTPGRGWRRG